MTPALNCLPGFVHLTTLDKHWKKKKKKKKLATIQYQNKKKRKKKRKKKKKKVKNGVLDGLFSVVL